MSAESTQPRFRIGIDVGGTFTDMFLWSSGAGGDAGEGAGGVVETFKVLSTPADPSIGVLDGLQTIADAKGMRVEDFVSTIGTIVHGTTVTTNATLTRRGAKTGLLTTHGVRDALEMRRGIRERQYDNRYQNVEPLVPRHLRLPVRGRIDAAGGEIEPLDEAGLREAIEVLRAHDCEAVALCFMNSFANPDHERAAAELVRSALPECFLSVSTEVLPTVRFYNRISTTALNAYAGPILQQYLDALTARLEGAGFSGVLLIMQSNGGVASPSATLERPAMTLLSGPAAGPRAALAYTRALGLDSCLTADMGGTSFDASLVRNGEVALKSEGDIERLRIALPMLDIITIGAGGGSIGWIDAGGLLRMGPQSAGAAPGPACYGRGGRLPTSTDADLVLGYLDPDYFAGGKMTLDVELARQSIAEHVGAALDLDPESAAAGMYRVINANMAHGVREITVKRGLDPREFPMVVAGGAGSLHACMIAHELGIPTIIVPPTASILCASGMLLSDLQHDFVRSCVAPLADLEPGHLASLVDDMVAEGDALLEAEGVGESDREHKVFLDLRYLKQYHEVTVEVPRAAVKSNDLAAMASPFHAEHNRLYGYDLESDGAGLEIINLRVRSIGAATKPTLPRVEEGTGDPEHARKGMRRAYVPERELFDQVPIYDGHRLRAGDRIAGPALIERRDTTLFVSESYSARLDGLGSMILDRIEPAANSGEPRQNGEGR
jgi:N-methylhydantoinase A